MGPLLIKFFTKNGRERGEKINELAARQPAIEKRFKSFKTFKPFKSLKRFDKRPAT